MMHWILLLFVFQKYLFALGNLQNDTDALLENCKSAYNQFLPILKWPVRIDCDDLIAEGVPVNLTQCTNNSHATIISMKKQQTRETLTFNIKQMSNSRDVCTSKNMSVFAFPINSRPWIHDVNADVSSRNDIINISLSFWESISLPCHHPNINISAATASFPPNISYTSVWRRSTIDPRTSSTQLIPSLLTMAQRPRKESVVAGKYPSPFQLDRVDFYKSGIYSCEMRASGRRTYAVHYSVCVIERYQEVKRTPIVECQEEKEYILGTNLTLPCSVLIRSGAVQANDLELEWSKVQMGGNDVSVCSKSNTDNKPYDLARFGKIACGWINLKNVPLRCINYQVPDGEMLSPDLLQFKIFINVSNLDRSDEGTYHVRFRYLDYWSEDSRIKLTYSRVKELQSRTTLLFSIFASLLLLVILVTTIWYNKTKLLLFKRKHFGSFDKDDKEYVSSLYYYFDQQMDDDDLESTRIIVNWTRETLVKLSYNYLDSQEKFQPGFLPETILSNISRSQTLIVILTQPFTNDNDSMFIANQGYLSMLKNETKLILIATPGVTKAIKLKNSRFSKGILQALKGSNVIHWKKSTRENRFKEALQYALPHIDRSNGCNFQKLKTEISLTSNKI